MIEQINNALVFYSFYTALGSGKTGLTDVTLDVYKNGTISVTAGTAAEVGDGVYKYSLAAGTVNAEGEYIAIFKTADTSVDQKHIPAMWVIQKAGVEYLDASIIAAGTAIRGADNDTLKTLSDQIDDVQSLGVGAIEWTYNLLDGDGVAIADADIWVTTDEAGTIVVASGDTDSSGNVTFFLDAGTYYVWGQKSGYDFTNPDTEVVA